MSRTFFAVLTTSLKFPQGVDSWTTGASGPVATRLTGAIASDRLHRRSITAWLVASFS